MKIIRNVLIILFACISIAFAQDFGYTGGVQNYTVPTDGWYKLEVWGSEGHPEGYPGNGNWQAQGNVGFGGHSVGYVRLSAGDILYIVCGGYGANAATAGYNGGGGRHGFNADFGAFYHWIQHNPGGGATHIALNSNRGELKNYVNNQNEVLIVAGGGAGRPWDNGHSGGSGGGTNGGNGSGATGASQSSGNAFGQGGTGAGGGWYGGTWNWDGASGGSGYIGGVTSWNGNSPYMENGTNAAMGKASITLVQEDPKYYLDLNYYINGTSYVSGLDEAVKADVYINGVLVASNTDDYYTMHPNGTKYKIVAKPKTGYALLSGSNICEGTINNTHSYCEFSLGKKYTVTVNPNNGTSTIVTTKLWSQIYRLPDAPVKKGYTFVAWQRIA